MTLSLFCYIDKYDILVLNGIKIVFDSNFALLQRSTVTL